jgi:hypothetical protein
MIIDKQLTGEKALTMHSIKPEWIEKGRQVGKLIFEGLDINLKSLIYPVSDIECIAFDSCNITHLELDKILRN